MLFCLIWGASQLKVHQRCSNNFFFNDFFKEIIVLFCCTDHETCIYETLVKFDIKGLPFFGTKIHLTKQGFKEIESNYWFRKCFYKELIWHLRLIEKRFFYEPHFNYHTILKEFRISVYIYNRKIDWFSIVSCWYGSDENGLIFANGRLWIWWVFNNNIYLQYFVFVDLRLFTI